MRIRGAVLAPLVALAACGDPHAASKDNFRRALVAHFHDHCIFVTPSVGLAAFPVTVSEESETTRFDALASAGLLTSRAQASEHPGPLGIGTVRDVSKTFDLTDRGRALFQNGAPDERGFCAGHYRVDDVASFTAPHDENGAVTSDVTFTVTPVMEPWVANADVQARYGDQLAEIKPTTDRTTLVRTDKGWTYPP